MKTLLQVVLLFLLLSPKITFSQKSTSVINGTVLSADGEPANGVTIELKKSKRVAVADANFQTV
jgi:hypothetical protein